MTNLVKDARKLKRLSQRALAELVGTSQQQIQRIESGLIKAKLDLAVRICAALDMSLDEVFPGAGNALEDIGRELTASRRVPDKGFQRLRKTGIEGDPRNFFVHIQLRGYTKPMIWEIPADEQKRLSDYMYDREQGAGLSFAVFDAVNERVAVNLQEVVYHRFTWEPGFPTSASQGNQQSAEGGMGEPDGEFYFVGVTEPLGIHLPADEAEDESEDSMGQCNHAFYMLEQGLEPGWRLSFDDEDGERLYVRVGSLALMTVSHTVLSPDASDVDADQETD